MLTDSRSIYVIPWPLPSAPTSLNAVGISSSQINLSWGGSAVGLPDVITRYYIYRNGNYLTSVNNLTLSYSDTGLAAATTYTYNVAAVGAHGNISPLSNTTAAGTQGAAPGGLDFPRVAIVAYGGDQSYGRAGTSGFSSYTASGPGTAAYSAVQKLGSYDIAYIAASFETAFNSSPCPKSNLVTAIKSLGNFPNSINSARGTFVFLYSIMESSQNLASGSAYQAYVTQVNANNWWLYPTTTHSGSAVGSAASGSGWFDVNYSYAWPGAAGSAAADTSICGQIYGSLSASQGPAQTAATYFASALLTTNRLDSRFTALPAANAAANADGLFLDNCFIYPNAGGNLAGSSASWDGISTQGNATLAAYPTGSGSLMSRGQFHFFQTYQSYLAACNPGSTYLNVGNFGSYANTTDNGDTHAITASAMDNVFHGGFIEAAAGVAGFGWQVRMSFAQILANYNYGLNYCQSPKLVSLHLRTPSTDGSLTSTWFTGGTAQTVAHGTALEYQSLRCMLTLVLLNNGFLAIGNSGYNFANTPYYDEFGDDSLTQVNVKKGYLGQPISGEPTSPMFAIGPLGIWGRQFANGIALCNPWGNGVQTLTTSQLSGVWFFLKGTQLPSVNSGAQFSSFTFADGDGLILVTSGSAPAQLAITNVNPLVPQATVGSIYGKTMNATGGVPPYSWSLVSAVPDSGSWISVTAGGVLQGTPSTAETETITIQVTDSVPTAVQRTYSLVVNAAAPLAISTTSPLPAATQSSAYSTTISATGGQTPYTWAITANSPNTGAWSSINPSTGVLSGTPGTAETESITIRVTDAVSSTVSKTFALTVNAAAGSGLSADPYSAYTNTWYLDPVNGSDSNNGLTRTTAFATLQTAVNKLTVGSSRIICIPSGNLTMSNQVTWPTNSGTSSSARCVVQGDPTSGNTLFKIILNGGGGLYPNHSGNTPNWLVFRKLDISTTNISTPIAGETAALWIDPTPVMNGLTVEYCSIHDVYGTDNTSPVFFQGVHTNFVFQNSKFFNAYTTGGGAGINHSNHNGACLFTYQTPNVIVKNCDLSAGGCLVYMKRCSPSTGATNGWTITNNIFRDAPGNDAILVSEQGGGDIGGFFGIDVEFNLFYNVGQCIDQTNNENTVQSSGFTFAHNTIANDVSFGFGFKAMTNITCHSNVLCPTTKIMALLDAVSPNGFVNTVSLWNNNAIYTAQGQVWNCDLYGATPKVYATLASFQGAHTVDNRPEFPTANPDVNSLGFASLATDFPNNASHDWTIATGAAIKGIGQGGTDPGYVPTNVGPGW